MKKAILTIVSGEKYEQIWEKVEPFFVGYAEKCDATLIVLKDSEGLPSPHWMKFAVYDLLWKEFHRVAFIDADIIIRDDTPSLFDIVPEDKIGIFDEGEHTPRAICIYEVAKAYGISKIPNWNGHTYYNTGVFVVSRQHRHIFKINEEIKPLRNSFGEQTYLNMKILTSGVEVFKLSHHYNRMSIMDRITGMTRRASYIIHYAGDGDNLFNKMDRDIESWEKDKPDYKYKRNIFIWALGGIGDMVATEPTIRYIREKVYPNSDIYLMSLHPYLYDHIENLSISKDYPDKELDAVFEINTHPIPGNKFGEFVPYNFTHCADWAALSSLGRQLTDKEKEYQLTYTDEHLEESSKICNNLKDLVLVHPGFGWPTKTFPVEWWQKLVDDLDVLGLKVGIIGKEENKQHSCLPIVCPKNGVDFRNKLSVKGLIALISKAKILISNDSAPIHIAGAFNNYIILIPTCKHPDYVLPIRNGDKYYKAAAIYKKLIEDDNYVKATDLCGWQAKEFIDGHTIDEYIPNVEDVIKQTLTFNKQYEKSYCLLEEEKENERFNKGCINWNFFMEPDKRRFARSVCGQIANN